MCRFESYIRVLWIGSIAIQRIKEAVNGFIPINNICRLPCVACKPVRDKVGFLKKINENKIKNNK